MTDKKKIQQLQKKAQILNSGLFQLKPTTSKYSYSTTIGLIEQASEYLIPRKTNEQIITKEQDLINYIDKCLENGVDAIDTETTGLDVFTDKLAGICLYTPNMNPIYIPINHVDYKTNIHINNQLDIEIIKRELKRIEKNKHFYHTAKFELKQFLIHLDLDFDVYWDCYIADFFITPEGRRGLKYLYERDIVKAFENNGKSYNDLFGSLPFTQIPLNIATIYAAGDAYKTYELGMYQLKKLKAQKDLYNVYKYIELPLVKIITNMELQGLNIDFVKAKELSLKYHADLQKAEQTILDISKEYNVMDINLSSPIQLKELLINKMGALSTGSSTNEVALSKIQHPIGKALLEYRKIEKLLGTYIDKFPLAVNEKTNKIHTEFKQLGTDTGRFASRNPNILNIPSKNKEVRQMFIPPEGYVWLSGDYSKQEIIILAQMANEQVMLDSFKNNEDIYVAMASKLYNLSKEQCQEFNIDGSKNSEGAKRRSNAKSLVLGMLYGMGAKKLAEVMKMDIQEAKKIIQDFKNAYPNVIRFIKQSEQMMFDKGYVTTICQRRRYLPDAQLEEYEITGSIDDNKYYLLLDKLNDLKWDFAKKKQFIEKMKNNNIYIKDNGMFISKARRQAVNSRIQGSAADIIKLAMIRIAQNKRLQELGFKIIIQAYDELIGICPEEHRQECAKLMADCMIEAPKKIMPNVEFKVDIEISKRWYGEII